MDHLYKNIQTFQFRCNDLIDDPTHHAAIELKQAVQKLEDDAQVRKNAYSLEDQVKRVINALHKAGHEQVMSSPDVHVLVHQCEHFIQELRKMR